MLDLSDCLILVFKINLGFFLQMVLDVGYPHNHASPLKVPGEEPMKSAHKDNTTLLFSSFSYFLPVTFQSMLYTKTHYTFCIVLSATAQCIQALYS